MHSDITGHLFFAAFCCVPGFYVTWVSVFTIEHPVTARRIMTQRKRFTYMSIGLICTALPVYSLATIYGIDTFLHSLSNLADLGISGTITAYYVVYAVLTPLFGAVAARLIVLMPSHMARKTGDHWIATLDVRNRVTPAPRYRRTSYGTLVLDLRATKAA